MRGWSDHFHKLFNSSLNDDKPHRKISNKSASLYTIYCNIMNVQWQKFWSMRGWSQPIRRISSESNKYKLSYRVTRNVRSLSRFTFVRSLRSLAQLIIIYYYIILNHITRNTVHNLSFQTIPISYTAITTDLTSSNLLK